ncbi:MAG: hypothetical protein QOK28_874 [Actinomycetota bacterium]|jgi:putative flippase GtrA
MTLWRRLFRYSAVSVAAIVIGQVALVGYFYFLHWSARPATIAASITSGVPAYYLNRRWAWGKSGRSHVLREVVPFWTMTFAGLVLSAWLAGYAGKFGQDHFDSRAMQTVIVDGASIAAFGALWVLKFVVFDRFMFTSETTVAP